MNLRGAAFPGNSNLLIVSGEIDTLDPTDSSGNPKLLSTATVTWLISDAKYPAGTVLGSGSGVWSAALGAHYCELSHSLALIAEQAWWVHVEVTSGTYKAVLDDTFTPPTRTGRTPTT